MRFDPLGFHFGWVMAASLPLLAALLMAVASRSGRAQCDAARATKGPVEAAVMLTAVSALLVFTFPSACLLAFVVLGVVATEPARLADAPWRSPLELPALSALFLWFEGYMLREWRQCYQLWRRTRRGLCGSCGYDLTGNVSGTCPECGTPAPTAAKA